MAFIRFVVSEVHPDSGVNNGLFDLAYTLRDADDVSNEDRQVLADQLAWFAQRLSTPKRFNRSSSKGYYRRTTRGIAWFRDTAIEHIARMHEMRRIVEANGHAVELIREERIGYVVYEDDVQVVAEPFSDTRTS
jgi:hypothetical protein